jgi:DNA mismatch repair protein MutL
MLAPLMGKIAVLPESLVNQIAAGEVVERPASVVKELCENALDAGAHALHVEVDGGGLSRILVRDDGTGMVPDDVRLAFERHATSKLVDAEGLNRISTFGFRGEALPAIASVSRTTLTTRVPSVLAAVRITLEGGRVTTFGEIGAPVGTSVLVEDLFFNTPARRKFMRRASTEAGHCEDALVRLALARPDVAITLTQDGKQSFSSPAGADPKERIALALGREAFGHLVPVQGGGGPITVGGFAADPDFSAATARGIYLFVNRRFVRDRGLSAAVQRAYSDFLPRGRYPAVVLFLDVPTQAVDVNVHPQKLEVRFAEPREPHDAVYRALAGALRQAPWLQHRPAISPEAAEAARNRVAEALAHYAARPESPVPSFSFPPSGALPQLGLDGASLHDHGAEGVPVPGFFSALRVIGQLAQTYIVCEAPGGSLVVVDQHAAHERVKFDALRRQLRDRTAGGQPFLFASTLTLPPADARVLAAHLDEVRALGFDLEPFGGAAFALKAVPAPLVGADYSQILSDLAQELVHVEHGRAFDEAMNDVLARMACHAAVRAHQVLSPEEARALLDTLDRVDHKARCPHGRPVAAEIPLPELERKVGRRN